MLFRSINSSYSIRMFRTIDFYVDDDNKEKGKKNGRDIGHTFIK
jgi:hypothetical protein